MAEAKTTKTTKKVSTTKKAPAKTAAAKTAASKTAVTKTSSAKSTAAKTAAPKATAATKKAAPKTSVAKSGKSVSKKNGKKKKTTSLGVCIATGIICAILGLLVGFYPLGAGFAMGGKTTIPESDLDKPVGMYIVNGVPNFITARQALDEGSGLSSAQQSDGSYTYPSADEILSSVRTAVLNGAVTARGITVSDDEMKEYAENQLGTDDFSKIATQYGLDENNVQNFVRQAAGIKKLQAEVTGISADQTAPTAPENGKDAATYKSYIINLLGNNWDKDKNTWANEDNDYFKALNGTAFAPDQATYEQASTVYSIASKAYQSNSASAAQKWNDFVNDALKNCQVRIGEAIL